MAEMTDEQLLAVYGGAGNLVGLRAVIEADRKARGDWRPILEAVMREIPRAARYGEGNSGNAPGHGHRVPGIWDSDNRELAGKPCAWCLAWNTAKAMLEADR